MTLRIGSLEEGDTSLDHEATWLLGHTDAIGFGDLWEDEGDLYVEAVLHVPCRFLRQQDGQARCSAHGFRGAAPRGASRPAQPRQLGGDRFRIVDRRRPTVAALPGPARSLPVLVLEDPVPGGPLNPCATAPCRTADNRVGAACCRDLQVEIMCTRDQAWLEALVRSRRSPYLCKVTRPGDFSLEAEVISACGYLDRARACTLHGRSRPDGRPAKPDLCSDWPHQEKALHPGCVFRSRTRPKRAPGRLAQVCK
ncbi:MAG: hypothetical protein ACREMG_09945 [Gemmatimonadales bacterium]